MNPVYLSLGSNLKTGQRQLRLAIKMLAALPQTRLLKTAPFYKNPAWGKKSQPHFMNTVILLSTRLQPWQLLRSCQDIEKQMGRVRKIKWGARIIDIDILYYANRKIRHPQLKLPHPFIEQREFVTIPLSALLQEH
ncbi:MAG: 2-amino-4-hydroxy-6-hydroxymethyldihydropteridine diphosphokinase [Legionellaceae bacterium]|nr:2-amino-4-hydroxy-6-hydroxymethyldihydropteridine diphosphokinase [Legionellaceae bacterium]